MSKERLLKILHEFHEDNNWLCYEYDKDLNGFHLYENGNKVAEFFLDNYALVMSDETDTSVHPNKAIRLANTKCAIRLATARYIVQEEELRNKKYKYKAPKFLRQGNRLYLVRDLNDDFFVGYGEVSNDYFQSNFTDEEIEYLVEKHGEDFRKFIDMCEKVEVE